MAKITVTKLFEYARVASSEAGKALKEFIDDTNQKFEQIIRALAGNLTFEDNIKGEKISLTLKHNDVQVTNVFGGNVVGIIPLRVLTDGNENEALQNLSWYVDATGMLVVVPQFKNASTTEIIRCTFYILKS